jgi:hypothetical protein
MNRQLIALCRKLRSLYAEYNSREGDIRNGPDRFYPRRFIQESTQFDSFGEFHQQSPWEMETWDEIQQIPSTQLDVYVANTTQFDSWEEMKSQAATRNLWTRLGVRGTRVSR